MAATLFQPHGGSAHTQTTIHLKTGVLSPLSAWWRHDMELFSALLALCERITMVICGFFHKAVKKTVALFGI